jgi:nucleotide-binding universal stress UspA family protein
MFPTKIVLATDSSEEARRAAGLAADLAEKLDSELHLVYVEPMPGVYAYPESAAYEPELRNELREATERGAHEKLEAETEALGLADKVAGMHVAVGRPDAGIVRAAEDTGAGLVVAGSRGRGPIKRAVMGSVSDSVVRHAHCSVLVVRDGSGGDRAPGGPIVLGCGRLRGVEAGRPGAAAEISAATGTHRAPDLVVPAERQLYGHHSYSEDVKSFSGTGEDGGPGGSSMSRPRASARPGRGGPDVPRHGPSRRGDSGARRGDRGGDGGRRQPGLGGSPAGVDGAASRSRSCATPTAPSSWCGRRTRRGRGRPASEETTRG